MDLIRWGLGLDTHPTHIQSMGGRYTHDDDQQTPDTQTCSYQLPAVTCWSRSRSVTGTRTPRRAWASAIRSSTIRALSE